MKGNNTQQQFDSVESYNIDVSNYGISIGNFDFLKPADNGGCTKAFRIGLDRVTAFVSVVIEIADDVDGIDNCDQPDDVPDEDIIRLVTTTGRFF